MENAKKLLKAIAQFGFPVDQLSEEDFLKKDQFVQIGRPPQRIDLIASLSGVEFDEYFSNREMADIDGLKLPFIGLEDLKKSKRASGRYIDLDDLEHL